MRVLTYPSLKSRYTGLLGLDSLSTEENTGLLNSVGDRLRAVWYRADWPELTHIADLDLYKDGPTEQWRSADLTEDIVAVYSGDPLVSINAYSIDYILLDSRCHAKPGTRLSSVDDGTGTQVVKLKAQYRKSPDTTLTETTTSISNIPQFFEVYLLRATYADYLKADGQMAKAAFEEERAELAIAEAIERNERFQNQNTIKVNSYQAPFPKINQAKI
jgi:hypothetical protein